MLFNLIRGHLNSRPTNPYMTGSSPRFSARNHRTPILDLYCQVSKELNLSAEAFDPTSTTMQELEELVLNLKGRDWAVKSFRDRERLVELSFQYWRRRGFPYSSLSDANIVLEYSRLEATKKDQVILDNEIQSLMVGIGLANCFHPQMWSVKVKGTRSPLNCFSNDAALRNLIRKALNIWEDRSAINASNLRRMLASFSHTARVSNFRPTAAKAIYERYSKNADTVLDFSAGYGGRMLGCLPLDRTYIGIDPCTSQVKGLRAMGAKLKTLVKVRARTKIYRACAENFMPTLRPNSVALVFSSPPYFNLERYSDEKSQSYIKYPHYEDWLDEFLKKIFIESKRILKRGGRLVVNVADVNGYCLTEDVMQMGKRFFMAEETLKLKLVNLPYLRGCPARVYKYEPVFVFKKN